MRLIHTRTLELLEFSGDKIPEEYAILSHTWEDEEVTFQDWQDLSVAKKKKGFFKIDKACKQAQGHGLNYLWVDTNCIDKSSSAELSEAVNSMFSWYQEATTCYAFLSDVEPMARECESMTEDYVKHFCESKWFTRGWTLQELLAPFAITFFSLDWSEIASRSTMAQAISETTRIDTEYLQGNRRYKKASIAQKMSWVSRRVTTRVEDMAYCMLGIFEINMPLLYGEGTKSFTRLQEEIIRHSNDQTIFCWTWVDLVPPGWASLLAPCPQAFRYSANYVSVDSRIINKVTFKMTNAGLSIVLPVAQTWSYYLGILNAKLHYHPTDYTSRLACVPLQGYLDTDRMGRRGAMQRIPFPSGPVSVYPPWVLCQSHLYVRSNPTPGPCLSTASSCTPSRRNQYSFLLVFDSAEYLLDDKTRCSGIMKSRLFNGICLMESARDIIGINVFPPDAFDRRKSLIMFNKMSSHSGALIILGMKEHTRVLFIGVSFRSHRTFRYCGIVPRSVVNATPPGPELLDRQLSAMRAKEKNCEVSWGDGIGITMGEAVHSNSGMICVTHITCDRGNVGLNRFERGNVGLNRL
ncbi:hypothetical protein N8I77_011332 [Diaporthe amygdali]|uniref:Heterokaryon incompatibility domain-containing protein n=1 Tax=Phomopsis amygdali TaxID=1214568 RepID=A0AAD9S593_PHOAM|nr:hypothetical protein N8I77_011332 [Diaporthe amygdali]